MHDKDFQTKVGQLNGCEGLHLIIKEVCFNFFSIVSPIDKRLDIQIYFFHFLSVLEKYNYVSIIFLKDYDTMIT